MTRLQMIFPTEWKGIDQFERICKAPDDDEAYEKTIGFLGKKWNELAPIAWKTHGPVAFLTFEALLYYIPSLLYWAHVDYKSVSLAFDSFLYMLSDSSAECVPFYGFTLTQRWFIADFISLFPDALSDLYGIDEYLDSSLKNYEKYDSEWGQSTRINNI
jgi:hypothetical protein